MICPAFVWWNQQLGFPPDRHISNTCPQPDSVVHIWEICFPSFIYYIDIYKAADSNEYWLNIRQIIKDYLGEMFIPDPTKNFDLFVQLLYALNKNMHPTNAFDSLTLLESINPSKRKRFLLYELPLLINDFSLYVYTLYEAFNRQSKVWLEIKADRGTVLALLSNSYLLKQISAMNNDSWDMVLVYITVMCELIKTIPSDSEEFENHMENILNAMISIVQVAPESTRINIARIFFKVCNSFKKKITNFKSYLLGFLENIPTDSYIFNYSIQHCIINYPKMIRKRHSSILKLLHKRKISSADDYDLYVKMMPYSPKDVILTMIYQKSLQNSVYFRYGLSLILKLMVENAAVPTVVQWSILFCRRIIIFLLLSVQTHKYMGRIPFICDFLSQALKSDINNKVLRQIKVSIATIQENGFCPSIVPQVIDLQDSLTLKEYRMLKNHPKLVKELKFFPLLSSGSKFSNIAIKKGKSGKKKSSKKVKLENLPPVPENYVNIDLGTDTSFIRMIDDSSDSNEGNEIEMNEISLFGQLPIPRQKVISIAPMPGIIVNRSNIPLDAQSAILPKKQINLQEKVKNDKPKSILFDQSKSFKGVRIDLAEKTPLSKSLSTIKKPKKKVKKKTQLSFKSPDAVSYTPRLKAKTTGNTRTDIDPTETTICELPNLPKPVNIMW